MHTIIVKPKKITASSTNSTYFIANAINHTSFYQTMYNTTTSTIVAAFSESIIIDKISMATFAYDYTCGAKNFNIYGSNDNSTWIKIYSKTDNPKTSQVQTFFLNNNIKYLYYKIDITANNGGGYVILSILDFYNLIYDTKYLIQDKNSILFTFNGTDIVQAPSQTLDENNFKNSGIDNITTITEEQWNKTFTSKEDIKILMWTDDIEKQEAKLTYECEPFELTDWLKKDECKLLVYTDDLEKKECEMIYNCNPYRPIDKLKETGDTCKVLIKEV